MATWKMLQRGRDRTRGLRGNTDIILYGAKDIATVAQVDANNRAYTITKNDIESIELDPSFPVREGDAHPDPAMAGAICVRTRLVEGPRMGRAIVAVYYDSNITFGSAPSRTALNYAYDDVQYAVPQAMMLLSAPVAGPPAPGEGPAGTYYVHMNPFYLRRQRIRITQRRTVSVVMTEDNLNGAIVSNYGKVYKPGGIPSVLTTANVYRIRIGYYELTYVFESWGPVRGITLPHDGFLLPVPNLDYLEEWYVDTSTPNTKIRKHLGSAEREEGGVLP